MITTNLVCIVLFLLVFSNHGTSNVHAQSVSDPNLAVESFTEGLNSPTSMAFIDSNTILVLEKNGQVKLVSNGQLQPEPVLEVPVKTESERGLLGIAVLNEKSISTVLDRITSKVPVSILSASLIDRVENNLNLYFQDKINSEDLLSNLDEIIPTSAINGAGIATLLNDIGLGKLKNTNVFLYYTESVSEEEGDNGDIRNRVYKYGWNDQTKTLENPSLIVDLPALPGPNHDGGKLMIGPDNLLYGVIGDLNRDGQLQNFEDGPPPDDTGIIFRVNPDDGSPPTTTTSGSDNPFSSDPDNPLSKYYAYGIRNSFGLASDPVTGNVWMTENGPASNDEINLANPGFNSGWQTIFGPMSASGNTEEDLVMFEGAHYADPLLTWLDPVAVTDIEFLKSSSLGASYTNNVFVGDHNNGNLYYFELNPDRTALLVLESVPDLVVDNEEEQSSIIFGEGFGSITDLVTGPGDGYLYILSYADGTIYRVIPA